jgi:hypothetical protein
MRIAVEFLVATQGLTVPKGLLLRLDRTQVVLGYIPKNVFKRRRV